MVFCSECGTKHENDAVFCENCGTKLVKPVKNVSETVVVSKTFDTSKSKYGKPIKIFGIVVIALIVLTFGRNMILGYNDPGVKLFHGTVKALQESKPEFELVLSVEDADKNMSFLEDMSLEFAGSMKNDELSGKMLLKNGRKDLAEGVVAYKDENVFIDLMDLYDDVMYMDASYMSEDIKAMFEMKDYLQDLDIKGVKWKTYGKIFTDEMGSNIEKDGSDVVLTLDTRDMTKAVEAMYEEALDDKDLKNGGKKALEKMMEKMIKDDFEIGYTHKGDFEDSIDYFNENWDDAYEELLYNIKDAAMDIIYELDYSDFADQEMRFSFTFNKLTGIESVMALDGLEIKAELSLKDGYNAKSYKTKKAEDLTDFDDKDSAKMLSEVLKNVLKNIEKDKDLVKDIERSSVFQMLSWSFGIEDMDDLMDYIEDSGIESLMYMFMGF